MAGVFGLYNGSSGKRFCCAQPEGAREAATGNVTFRLFAEYCGNWERLGEMMPDGEVLVRLVLEEPDLLCFEW